MVRFVCVAVAVVSATLLVGCGSDETPTPKDGVTGSRTLTVYASLPLQGEASAEARDAVDAIKLALSDAEGRVGPFTVNLSVLDDATTEAGGWDRDATLESATRAARDRNAIALIGDWDSDASALSIPVLNAAELAQVSPASGYVGLTRADGVAKGEPEKYYPSSLRTFARVVPADDLQASAMLSEARRAGARSLYLINDRSLYGKGLMAQVREQADAAGLLIVGDESVQPSAKDYLDVTGRVAKAQPSVILVGASVRNGAVTLLRDVTAPSRRRPVIVGEALLLRSFARRMSGSLAPQISIVSPAIAPSQGPTALTRFHREFTAEFKRAPTPMAAHAYAAMETVLAAIKRAGKRGNEREAVREALANLTVAKSAIGPIKLDRRGDTAETRFGVWTVRDGRARFVRSVDVR